MPLNANATKKDNAAANARPSQTARFVREAVLLQRASIIVKWLQTEARYLA